LHTRNLSPSLSSPQKSMGGEDPRERQKERGKRNKKKKVSGA
jgi:hypothetical protein